MADEKRRPVRAEKKKIEPKDEENSAGGDDDDAFRAAFKWWAINNPDPSLGRSRHPLVVGVVVKNADPERTCKVDLRYCGKAAGGSSRDVLVVDDDGRRKKIRGIASNVFGDPSAKSSTHLSVPTGSIAAPVSRRDSATQSFPRTDVARTSDKIFASVHGQWETLELATTLARHLAGDAETAEPRMEQFFCSETEGCRDAKLSNDAIAATIAQLVALGICDRGYRQIAKVRLVFLQILQNSKICQDRALSDRRLFVPRGDRDDGIRPARIHAGAHRSREKRDVLPRAVFLVRRPRGRVRLRSLARRFLLPFRRPTDFFGGCEFAKFAKFARRPAGDAALRKGSSSFANFCKFCKTYPKHRNGVAHKESVVFAMPLEYGFARDSFPCLACRGSAQQNSEPPKCPLTMPVALCIRNADENPARSLVTASDIKMVACLVAARRYDEMVCDGCVETDAACVATLCASENLKWRTVSEAIAANAARAVEAKIKVFFEEHPGQFVF